MTVRHHVLKYLGLNEDLVMKVLNDFYMDDSISGSDSSEKCFEFYSQIKKKKPKRRELNLRKWISNCSGILKLMNC